MMVSVVPLPPILIPHVPFARFVVPSSKLMVALPEQAMAEPPAEIFTFQRFAVPPAPMVMEFEVASPVPMINHVALFGMLAEDLLMYFTGYDMLI